MSSAQGSAPLNSAEKLAEMRSSWTAMLRDAARAKGIFSPSAFRSRLGDVVDRSTLSRYWNGAVPTKYQEDSRANVERIAKALGCQALLDAWNEIVDFASAMPDRRHNVDARTWFGVTPPQPGHDFVSVDRISYVHLKKDHEIDGMITRVHSRSDDESGLQWKIRGHLWAEEALFFTFWPLDARNASSVGTMSIARQKKDHRAMDFAGYYHRCVDLKLITRAYEAYAEFPEQYAPDVAVLDLDNTLFDGWSLISWLESLDARTLRDAKQLLNRARQLREQHHSGLSHDMFAEQLAQEYFAFLAANDTNTLGQAVRDYVTNHVERAILPYATPLIRWLKVNGIAPTLVTGAPAPLARAIADKLGIRRVFALDPELTMKWLFPYDPEAGEVLVNPGTSKGKAAIVRRIRATAHNIRFAAGDSDSDEPILRSATRRLLRQDAETPHPELGPGLTCVVNGKTTGAEVIAWLDANVDPSPLRHEVNLEHWVKDPSRSGARSNSGQK